MYVSGGEERRGERELRGPDAGWGRGASSSTLQLHCNCRAAASSKSLYSASHPHHTTRPLVPKKVFQCNRCSHAVKHLHSRVHLSPHNSPSSSSSMTSSLCTAVFCHELADCGNDQMAEVMASITGDRVQLWRSRSNHHFC